MGNPRDPPEAILRLLQDLPDLAESLLVFLVLLAHCSFGGDFFFPPDKESGFKP